MLNGSKAEAARHGMPVYSLMKLYKTGIIPGISIGQGRGSKLLFDPVLVDEALRRHMVEEQKQRQNLCSES